MSEEINGKVKSWGVRLTVPAPIIKAIGLGVGDDVRWGLEKRDGETVAILQKKEGARE